MAAYQKTLVPHAGMTKPLAVEIRPSDHGVQIVAGISENHVDEVSLGLIVVDFDHHEIHEGNRYFVKNWQDVDGAGTTLNFLFTVPNTAKVPHATWELSGEEEFTFTLYEGTTVTNNGTPVPVFNHNRNSSHTPGVGVFAAPTITNMGTIIWATKIGTGKSATEGRTTEGELVARAGINYLFRIVKAAAGTAWIDYLFDWYEHEEGGS